MAKIGSPTKRPTSKGGFCGDQEESAAQLVTNRERGNKSGPLAASVRVKFMELRPSMCRWPIGDPKHIETFRFCGSACSSGAIYIARRTPQKPTLQTAQGRHVRPIFSCNTQLESRDSIGSVARAIWTAGKLRASPQRGSRYSASRADVAYYVWVRKLRHPHSLQCLEGDQAEVQKNE